MVKRKTRRTEVDTAERIHGDLINKRDEQNIRATELREGRDIVHEQKRELIERMSALKGERDALVAEMKRHKERRGEFQSKARALLDRKKSVFKGMDRGLPGSVEGLKLEIRELELRHQTNPSSITQERDLLDLIRVKTEALKELEARMGEHEELTLKSEDLESMIDEAFKKADAEHAEVVRLSEEAEAVHQKVVAFIEEINHLSSEGDKKHKAYLEARALADKYHQKAQEMRQKLMATRREAREERARQDKEMDEINKAVKERFDSEEAKKEAEEEILDILKKKGKVSLKR
jgi:phosphoserine phosphatase